MLLDPRRDYLSAPSSVGTSVIRLLRDLTPTSCISKLLFRDSLFAFFFLLFFALGH
jgi:hypothetical protein